MDQHAAIAVIGLTKDPLVWWSKFRGALQCGVQPDAVLQAGLLTTGLPGGGLRHGASPLPGACGDDRGAECGGDPLDLQCGLPAATRSQPHAAKSRCGIATFGIPVTRVTPTLTSSSRASARTA